MPPRSALLTVLLLLGAALSYLLGNWSTPLMDRDEPRYALTSRNMLISGDYVVPRQYDIARTAKPPMIYWLQSTSMRFLGDSAFAARLPSSIAMLILVALVLVFFWWETDSTTALLTATIFASVGLTGFVGKLAITDATHVLLTGITLACTYRLYRGAHNWVTYVTLGIATGLALLTKGPIAAAVAGMTVAALALLAFIDRFFPPKASPSTFSYSAADELPKNRRWIRLGVAVAIALAIALPWAVMVNHAEPDFFGKVFKREGIDRTTHGVDGQGRPPGFYFLVMFGTYFPYSLLIPATFWIGWQNRHRPLTRFCLAACIGPWIMFEAVVSKMVHWFLPVYLPLAYLTADAVVRCWRSEFNDLYSRGFRWGAIVASLCICAGGLAAYPALHSLNEVPWWVETLLFGWAFFMGTVPLWMLLRKNLPAMVAASAVGMFTLYPLIFGVLVPHLWFVNLPQRLAADLRALGAVNKGEVSMVGYKEPSLAFYQGGTIREADLIDLKNKQVKFAVIKKKDWDSCGPEVTGNWTILSTEKGVAYANSPNPIDVHIIGRKP